VCAREGLRATAKGKTERKCARQPYMWTKQVNPNCLLQHTAAHCNTRQYTATHYNTLQHTTTHCNTLQHAATRCNTLQHAATHYSARQHPATPCNTPQHTATHYLQHMTCTHLQQANLPANLKSPSLRLAA